MKIQKLKDNYYLFPLIGTLLLLITLLSPTIILISSDNHGTLYNSYLWMFGLIVGEHTSGVMILWIPPFGMSVIPVVASVILTSINIICLISNIVYFLDKRNEPSKAYLTTGILVLIGESLYMIFFEIFGRILGVPIWSLYLPNFGIIGGFISGILLIISYVIGKRILEINEIDEIRVLSSDKKLSKNVPFKTPKYCPYCGNKILYSDAQYCQDCGNQLSHIELL